MVCSQVRASSELRFGALREGGATREAGKHCRGEPDSALSGGYAPPDSAKAKGSSIVDEPGEG